MHEPHHATKSRNECASRVDHPPRLLMDPGPVLWTPMLPSLYLLHNQGPSRGGMRPLILFKTLTADADGPPPPRPRAAPQTRGAPRTRSRRGSTSTLVEDAEASRTAGGMPSAGSEAPQRCLRPRKRRRSLSDDDVGHSSDAERVSSALASPAGPRGSRRVTYEMDGEYTADTPVPRPRARPLAARTSDAVSRVSAAATYGGGTSVGATSRGVEAEVQAVDVSVAADAAAMRAASVTAMGAAKATFQAAFPNVCVVGTDAGRVTLVKHALTDFTGKEVTMSLTRAEYYNAKRLRVIRAQTEARDSRKPGVHAARSRLARHPANAAHANGCDDHLAATAATNALLWEHMSPRWHAQHQFASFKGGRAVIDNHLNAVKKVATKGGRRLFAAWGDAKFGSSGRGDPGGAPTSSLQRAARRQWNVPGATFNVVHEHLTSQYHQLCAGKLSDVYDARPGHCLQQIAQAQRRSDNRATRRVIAAEHLAPGAREPPVRPAPAAQAAEIVVPLQPVALIVPRSRCQRRTIATALFVRQSRSGTLPRQISVLPEGSSCCCRCCYCCCSISRHVTVFGQAAGRYSSGSRTLLPQKCRWALLQL